MASSSPTDAETQHIEHSTDTNMSRLAALPEELISNIAMRLDIDDLSNLRLTCRATETKSFFAFATEYFSGKCLMITTESLKVLVGIANSDRLRRYLHDVYVCTAFFSEQAFHCPNGCQNCAWQPTVRESEAYRTYMIDQKRLADGGDKDMLLKALSDLGHLNSIHVVDSVDALSKLGIGTAGFFKVRRRTGRKPMWAPEHGDDAEYTQRQSHVFKIVIQALAGSGCVVSQLDVSISNALNGLTLTPDLYISKELPALRTSLSELRRLRLTLRGKMILKKDKTPDRPASVKRIKKFASAFPAIEELTLAYDASPDSGFVHFHLMNNLQLASITFLSIDTLDIDGKSLASTLSRVASIKTLYLKSVNLTSSWLPILQLLNKVTTLDHLHMFFLQEAGRKAYFLTQLEEELPEDHPDFYGGDDWADVNDSEDSDSEMPDLEPAGTFDNPIIVPPGQAFVSLDTAAPEASAADSDAGKMPEFVAPGHEHMRERGYYICIHGAEKLAKYIPTFIKEYNLGSSLDDHMGMDLGLNPFAGPAGFNGIMNAMFGPPPPGAAPVPIPIPVLNPHHGLAGGPGNVAQNGLFTVGAGPGYQMMMGTMPMPLFPPHANQPPTAGAAAAQNGTAAAQAGPHATPGAQATTVGSGHSNGVAGGTTQASAGMTAAADGYGQGDDDRDEFLGEDDVVEGAFDVDDDFDVEGEPSVADLD